MHTPLSPSIGIVGPGRLGRALAAALSGAGAHVVGPVRDATALPRVDVVLLCVPEPALPEVARSIAAGPLVGHCSASAPLDALAPHERFVLHPLMTITDAGAAFAGAACAVDASSTRALGVAHALAAQLDMHPVHVPGDRRALYHAAASMASNYLVALESAAEELMAACGVSRAELAPLARAALENWSSAGFAGAITGPIARGDDATAARQRDAVAAHAPQWLALWDALANATRQQLPTRPTHAAPERT